MYTHKKILFLETPGQIPTIDMLHSKKLAFNIPDNAWYKEVIAPDGSHSVVQANTDPTFTITQAQIDAWDEMTDQVVSGVTPVNAVAATAIMTTGVNPTIVAGNTVTVGTQVYTFVAALSAPAVAYEVVVGASDQASISNLGDAIIHSGTGVTNSATVKHPLCGNTVSVGINTFAVTADTKGVAGNSIAVSTTIPGANWSAATLTGGVNGTVCDAGTLFVNLGKVYVSVAANTISTANIIPMQRQYFKELSGIMFQSAETAPSMVEHVNSYGVDYTLARTGAGVYTVTFATACLTQYKTVPSYGVKTFIDFGGNKVTYEWTSTTVITIKTYNSTDVATDGIINNWHFEIKTAI